MATKSKNLFSIFTMLFTLSLGALVVDRKSQGLTTIPADIDPSVTTLILSYNSITRVVENDMASLLLLGEINLDFNRLNFISTTAFINNAHLVQLTVINHQLLTFPVEVGGAWRSIEQVIGSLGPNNMQPIKLTNLPALVRLEINTNKINNLTLSHLPSLKNLYAQWCGLATFPDLSAAPALEVVALGNNYFTEIPASAMAGLNKLSWLYLAHCRIRHLPNLSHLVSLEELYINHNALKSLPDLYYLPLKQLLWAGNPLVCDKTLCWLRMWSFIRLDINMGNFPGQNVCEAPQHWDGLRVMGIHPVDMECYNGNVDEISSSNYNVIRINNIVHKLFNHLNFLWKCPLRSPSLHEIYEWFYWM